MARSDRRLAPPNTLALVVIGLAGAACRSEPQPDVHASGKVQPPYLVQRATDGGSPEGGLKLGTVMPEEFPESIPLYPSSVFTVGGRQTIAGGKRAWSVTTETTDAKEPILAYYAGHLPGFAKTSELALGDSHLSVWRGAAYDLDLMLGKGASGRTTVTLDVAEK